MSLCSCLYRCMLQSCEELGTRACSSMKEESGCLYGCPAFKPDASGLGPGRVGRWLMAVARLNWRRYPITHGHPSTAHSSSHRHHRIEHTTSLAAQIAPNHIHTTLPLHTVHQPFVSPTYSTPIICIIGLTAPPSLHNTPHHVPSHAPPLVPRKIKRRAQPRLLQCPGPRGSAGAGGPTEYRQDQA